MKRREFIGCISGALAAWPLGAHAQKPALPVIGFLNGASPESYEHQVAAFREGLNDGGFVEGCNVAIEYRWAEGHYDRLPEMAADLVSRKVAVIAATSTPANLVAKAATKTIPIVFTTGSDPVQLGLVASLSHPGGNVTGVTTLQAELAPKRFELAHELMPSATTVAILVNPANPIAEDLSTETQAAARTLGLQLKVMHASTDEEIREAFAGFSRLEAGVLIVGSDVFFIERSQRLAALALQYAVPTIFSYREYTAAGGLMSYSGSAIFSYHTAGVLTARILKGEKPANLPVQQATRIELIVNLKTAKAIGITIPMSLLGRADEVIE
jgi:putative tryptophan/tyrosine transport system substrate-binding protein